MPTQDVPTTGQSSSAPPDGWWESAFALRLSASEQAGHPCGQHQMLTLVAYDITDPKRLQKVAKLCEDYGMRVQYSLFECRLGEDQFADFWLALEELIEPDTDRLVAYKICLNCSRQILSAGTMCTTEKVVTYVF